MTDGGRRPLARIIEDPVVRVAAYYVLLAAGPRWPGRFSPGSPRCSPPSASPRSVPPVPDRDRCSTPSGALQPVMTPVALALTTALCMIGPFLLMLPVTWVYILTRQKKGFRQSVVQTLIILPIVVAGVVLLVKNSMALAFSLGGIVAAVSFRNTPSRHQGRGLHLPRHRGGPGVRRAGDVRRGGDVDHLQHRHPHLLVHRLRAGAVGISRARAPPDGWSAPWRWPTAPGRSSPSSTGRSCKSMSPEQLQALAQRARRRRMPAAASVGKPPKQPKPLDTVCGSRPPTRRRAAATSSPCSPRRSRRGSSPARSAIPPAPRCWSTGCVCARACRARARGRASCAPGPRATGVETR